MYEIVGGRIQKKPDDDPKTELHKNLQEHIHALNWTDEVCDWCGAEATFRLTADFKWMKNLVRIGCDDCELPMLRNWIAAKEEYERLDSRPQIAKESD